MKNIDQAIKILKKGGIVVYPTDTAYGLAVDATNVAAVKKLYQLKGRDFKNPIHVIPPSKASIGIFARISPWSQKLIDRLMPGPLTIVLPLKAKGQSWKMLSAGTGTIGVRLPKHRIALDLAKKLGQPITTTSANLSGKPICYSIADFKNQLDKSIYARIYVLDGGKLRKIQPSTVVSLIGRVKILRPGPISETQIKKVLK